MSADPDDPPDQPEWWTDEGGESPTPARRINLAKAKPADHPPTQDELLAQAEKNGRIAQIDMGAFWRWRAGSDDEEEVIKANEGRPPTTAELTDFLQYTYPEMPTHEAERLIALLPPLDEDSQPTDDDPQNDEDIATGDLAEFIRPLPVAIDPTAFYGPLGQYALNASGVTTEASATAIHAINLSAISALIGRHRWLQLGPIRIHPRVWIMLVGITATGRKGTAHHVSRALLGGNNAIDNVTFYTEVTTNLKGINSGEGAERSLIDSAHGDDEVSAHLWVGEFGAIMARTRRDSDTLSTFLRNTYDGLPVSRQTADPTKNGRVQFPHVTIAAGVTPAELRVMTNQTDKDSGFLNRFLVLGVEGTHIPGIPPDNPKEADKVARAIDDRLTDLRNSDPSPMTLSPRVTVVYNEWRRLNHEAAGSGAVGGMENRAENHVLSIAMTLAILDGQTVIEDEHFMAGLAFWGLHESTVRSIWAPAPKEGDQRRIWLYLRKVGDAGLPPSRLKQALFGPGRVRDADVALGALAQSGWIESFRVRTNSPPRLRAIDLRLVSGHAATAIAMLRRNTVDYR